MTRADYSINHPLTYNSTIEDTHYGEIEVNGKKLSLEILDTAGNESYSYLYEKVLDIYLLCLKGYSGLPGRMASCWFSFGHLSQH